VNVASPQFGKKSFGLIVLCVLPYWQSDSKRTSKITHQNIKPGERSLDDNDRVAVAILAAMIGAEMPCKNLAGEAKIRQVCRER